MKFAASFVAALALLPFAARAQTTGSGEKCFNNDQLCVYATLAGNIATIRMRVSATNLWGAIGIGAGMADADVWMAFVNGNTVTISDRISTGRSNPATDASQDLTLVPGQSQVNANGSYTVTFTRPLTTNDATDKPLTPAANQAFIWGVGASANGQISRHTARGAITGNFFLAAAPSPSAPAPGVSRSPVVAPPKELCFNGQKLCVSATVIGANARISIRVTGPTLYGSIGIGNGMSDTDMWIVRVVNNAIVLSDHYSTDTVNPPRDTTQSLTLDTAASTIGATSYTAVFTRALNTNDRQDKPILATGDMSLVWAMGTHTNGNINRHTDRGAITGTFISTGAAASPALSPGASPGSSRAPGASPSASSNPAAKQPICFDSDVSFCASMAYVTDTDQVRITFKVGDSATWAGLGIGKNMANADTWMAAVKGGKIVLVDGVSSGYALPKADAKQSLSLDPVLSSINDDGSWVAVFYRSAGTNGDAGDLAIPVNRARDYIWAVGPFDAATSTYSQHSTKGAKPFNFFVEANITSTDINAPEASPSPSTGLGGQTGGKSSAPLSAVPSSILAALVAGAVVLFAGW